MTGNKQQLTNLEKIDNQIEFNELLRYMGTWLSLVLLSRNLQVSKHAPGTFPAARRSPVSQPTILMIHLYALLLRP